MVPGHEIVGKVSAIGNKVTRFKTGDQVGVGCFVDSCRTCPSCKEGLEQYCDEGMTLTYNDIERDGVTPTYGGYSQGIVVDEHYVLKIPDNLPLDKAAPLLCAGITTYSPLKHWGIKKGKRVGVVGLGGLGHIAVQIASHMGAEVCVFSHSQQKEADSMRFGATEFINTSDKKNFDAPIKPFDLIIHTASAHDDINQLLGLLKRDATMVVIGLPKTPTLMQTGQLILMRRNLSGSLIGGVKETQEMLDFCSKHHISADIETISLSAINEAYTRLKSSDIRYRFVIELGRT